MTAPRDPDRLIHAFLHEGLDELPDAVYDAVRDRSEHTRQRAVIGSWRTPDMSTHLKIGLAAAAAVLIAVVGYQFLGNSNTGGPGASESPEPAATATPSWSREQAEEDWPGPLRTEPPDGAPVVGDSGRGVGTYSDPQGDVSPMAPAWVDIVGGEFKASGCYAPSPCVSFDLAASLPQPIPSPRDDWIAYGIVVDFTGDGLPDVRYGMDNAAGDGESIGGVVRMWRTDLGSETTSASACCASLYMEAFFPGAGHGPARGSIAPYGWTGTVFRFYVWASVIRDGEVVSTDYAPDFGWLEWP